MATDLSDGRLSRAALLVVDTQVKWTVLRKARVGSALSVPFSAVTVVLRVGR